MIREHIQIALSTIKSAKLRSGLTMLGIIIGVASVTTVVSIGQGVKGQLANEVNQFGTRLIQITPGKGFTKNDKGEVTGFNFAAGFGASTLSESDLEIIKKTNGVEAAAPFMLISSVVKHRDVTLDQALVMATTADYPSAFNQKIVQGNFFNSQQTNNVVVIGSDIARQLFGSGSAIGSIIEIRGERFAIVGVMKEHSSSINFGGPNINQALFIPLEAGKRFNQGVVQIMEIDAKATDGSNIDQVVGDIEANLRQNHGGQEDFSVVKQSDVVKVADTILGLVTRFVAAIAAISLIVGGIGIMNIMLVSVTERTHEIGLRKAVGATNKQILIQFLIESVVLTAVGGALGIGLAYAIVALITLLTDVNGSFAFSTIIMAAGVSGLVGVIFGIMPALKAARKDPITALRYE